MKVHFFSEYMPFEKGKEKYDNKGLYPVGHSLKEFNVGYFMLTMHLKFPYKKSISGFICSKVNQKFSGRNIKKINK